MDIEPTLRAGADGVVGGTSDAPAPRAPACTTARPSADRPLEVEDAPQAVF